MDLIKNDKYVQAIQIHNNIINNAELVIYSLCEMCKNLKQMRDLGLYTALGYDTFDDYCEQMAKIKSRQAYNYISTYERLGESFLQSNASLGITKLELLGQIPAPERDELIEDGEIDGKSVREIRQIVEDYKKATEQVTLFNDEISDLKDSNEYLQKQLSERDSLKKDLENAKSENDRIEKELKEIKDNPIKADFSENVADEDKIRKEIEKEFKAKQEEVVKSEVDKQVKKAVSDAEKAAADKAKAETESQYSLKIKTLEDIKKTAEEKTATLEKQLKMSDSSIATAKVYFDLLNNTFNKLIEDIKKMDDIYQDQLKGATKKLLSAYMDVL